MAKLIIAILVAYACYRLWRGPARYTAGRPIAPPAAPSSAADAKAEARAVLGLEAGASPREIKAAHRRLLIAVHPDKGGSAELTRRVNAARDTLLK
jgi:DnaJ homolog subfamily C member 19